MVATIKTIQGGATSVSKYFGLLDGVADYYGENSHSEWLGKGALLLGLAGQVERQRFENLLAGRSPNGHALGRIRASKPNSKKPRVPGYDLTLSVPKSVSVLWAIGSKDIQQVVERALRSAAHQAMNDLESRVPLARRGRGGKEQIQADLVIGMFFHKLSRENEPQLHMHCIVANVCRGHDQQWSAVNSRSLHDFTMTLGGIFREHLFEELCNRLSITLRPGQKRDGSQGDWSEIDEIPHSLVERFSTRSKLIEDRAKRHGLQNAASRQRANFATRRAKSEPLELSELKAIWESEARGHGLDPKALSETVLRDKPSLTASIQPKLVRQSRPSPSQPKKDSLRAPKSEPKPGKSNHASKAQKRADSPVCKTRHPKTDSRLEAPNTESPKSEKLNDLHVGSTRSPKTDLKGEYADTEISFSEKQTFEVGPEKPNRSQKPNFPIVDEAAYAATFEETISRFASTQAYFSLAEFASAMGTQLHRAGIQVPNLKQVVAKDLKTHREIVVLGKADSYLYSARAYYEKEKELVAAAKHLRRQRGARLSLKNADKASRPGRELNSEQAKAAFHLLTQTSAIKVLKAAAGSGVEKTLKAVCEGFQNSGIPVVGAALSRKATSELQEKTGLEVRTLASWLYHLDRPELKKATDALRHEAKMVGRAVVGKRRWEREETKLPKHGVIVVEQAGMFDTYGMSRLLNHAQKAKCTVILCGDSGQLQPIGVGGPFEFLCKTAGYAELKDHQRQKSPADQSALDSLRAQKPQDALRSFQDRGRFHVSKDPVAELMKQWGQSDAIRRPRDHLILTPTRELRDTVNRLCQAERKRRGKISGRGLRHGGTRYHVGDRIQIHRASARHGIAAGSSATVVGLNPITRKLSVKLDHPSAKDGSRLLARFKVTSFSALDLPPDSIDLAYASTTHSAHGGECEHVWCLIDGGHTTSESAYAQISHGKQSTRLFASKTDANWELGRVADDWSHSERKNLAHDVVSGHQQRIEH